MKPIQSIVHTQKLKGFSFVAASNVAHQNSYTFSAKNMLHSESETTNIVSAFTESSVLMGKKSRAAYSTQNCRLLKKRRRKSKNTKLPVNN